MTRLSSGQGGDGAREWSGNGEEQERMNEEGREVTWMEEREENGGGEVSERRRRQCVEVIARIDESDLTRV